MVEIPCKECFHYGNYSPKWCQVLGKEVNTVDDIKLYFERIPEIKTTDGCLGFSQRVK